MASSPRPFALVSASAAIRPHARDSLMVVDAEITDRNLNRNSDLLIRAIMDPLPDKARLSLASNPHSSPVLAVPRPTSPLAVPPLPLVQSPTLFPGIQVAPLPPAAAAPDASVIGPLGDVMDVDSLPQSSSSAAFSLQHPDRIPSLSSDKDDEDAMLDDLYDAVKSTVGRLKTANSFSSLSLQEHPLQPPVDINRMGVNFQILQSHQPHSAQDQITMDESVPATALLSLSGLEIKDKAVDASTMASTPFLNQTGTTSPSKRASSTRRVLSFLKSIDAAFGLDPDAGENADIDDEATASSGATEKVVRRVSLKKRLSNSASVGNSGGLASNKSQTKQTHAQTPLTQFPPFLISQQQALSEPLGGPVPAPAPSLTSLPAAALAAAAAAAADAPSIPAHSNAPITYGEFGTMVATVLPALSPLTQPTPPAIDLAAVLAAVGASGVPDMSEGEGSTTTDGDSRFGSLGRAGGGSSALAGSVSGGRRGGTLGRKQSALTSSDSEVVMPYVCELCTRAFLRKHDLKRHVSTTHGLNDSFRCENCRKSFTRNDALQRHIKGRCKGLRGGAGVSEAKGSPSPGATVGV